MTTLKLLSAGLIAVGMLATPAMARVHHPSHRNVAPDAEVYAAPAGGYGYAYGPGCTPAPRVGAFATQPWDNSTPCEPSYSYDSGGYYMGYPGYAY
ncbi:hypothetical protein JQ628_03190 [Bradyrhizobium lablabi]|uniref:hypothetical protein n=1 Tax=Bradyrhizobium lablabi TaxID=722472 RepID=UPI001BA81B78|nr:hypothetical protein [Bradyrhizobium lablabi]MBR1120508.1 hypothetical protein [Bradyrhizobium lablabi]